MLYLVCPWGELYGAINSNFWAGLITEEKVDSLRIKCLGTEEKENLIHDFDKTTCTNYIWDDEQ